MFSIGQIPDSKTSRKQGAVHTEGSGAYERYHAYIDLHEQYSDITLACASWGFPQTDYTHFDNVGRQLLGEAVAITIDRQERGLPTLAPFLKQPTLSGSTLTFPVVNGPVVIDETNPAHMHQSEGSFSETTLAYSGGTYLPNKGFEIDATDGTSISSVSIGADGNTVVVQLSKAPTASVTIRYAYKYAGGYGDEKSANRGTIRNAEAPTAYYANHAKYR